MSEHFKPYKNSDYLWNNFQALNKEAKIKEEIVQRYKTPGIRLLIQAVNRFMMLIITRFL